MAKKQKPAAEVAQTEINGDAVAPVQTETEAPAVPVAKDVQNGILRPKHLGIVGKLWAFFESASVKNNSPVLRAEVLVWATENEIKHSTATAQHARWRKYYGLTNSKTPEEIAAKKQEKEAAKVKAAEERKAKAEAKAVEKAAKEQAKKDKAAEAAAANAAAADAVAAAGSDVSIEADKVD